jgi:FkbM family methyltransferase
MEIAMATQRESRISILIKTICFIVKHPLNRSNRFRAVARYALWQILLRITSNAIVHSWIGDCQFFVRKGEHGIIGNIYTGLHEFADMGFLLHFLRQDDLFVDIGANSGSYSLLATAAIGARGIAIEPVHATFSRLVANNRLNNLGARLQCLNIALGDTNGTIKFTSDYDTVNHVVANDEIISCCIDVPVSRLDDILQDNTPALIKIDVEGFETPVVNGADATLRKNSLKALILELNGSGDRYHYDERKILQSLLDYGFHTYTYDPLTRKLIKLNGKCMSSGNTIFVRDEMFVSRRLRDARAITVLGHDL